MQLVKGIPTHGRCLPCNYHARRGAESASWKGGKVKAGDGNYIAVKLQPDDFFYSMTNTNGYVLEHRLLMARHLNRCLLPWEIVHHKGTKYPQSSKEDKADNRIENLQLLPGQSYHIVDSQIKRFIGKLENRVKQLGVRVTLLEAENTLLKSHDGASASGKKKLSG